MYLARKRLDAKIERAIISATENSAQNVKRDDEYIVEHRMVNFSKRPYHIRLLWQCPAENAHVMDKTQLLRYTGSDEPRWFRRMSGIDCFACEALEVACAKVKQIPSSTSYWNARHRKGKKSPYKKQCRLANGVGRRRWNSSPEFLSRSLLHAKVLRQRNAVEQKHWERKPECKLKLTFNYDRRTFSRR